MTQLAGQAQPSHPVRHSRPGLMTQNLNFLPGRLGTSTVYAPLTDPMQSYLSPRLVRYPLRFFTPGIASFWGGT